MPLVFQCLNWKEMEKNATPVESKVFAKGIIETISPPK